MPYTSSTKSWASCNKDQRRECIAHAVFNKLSSLPGSAKWFVVHSSKKLIREMKHLENLEFDSLNSDERGLLVLKSLISSLGASVSGIRSLERIFTSVEKFLSPVVIDPLGSSASNMLLSQGKLSSVVDAIDHWKWTGSSNGAPNGKSESSIGIPDSLLDKLMSISKADGLLTSWLQAGDAKWKRWVDSELDKRRKEIESLARIDPKHNHIRILELEMARLAKDWKL